MRTKRVNRYYCEYCKKSGCSAPHMSRHEKRCTLNPNRTCGVCGILEVEQQPLAELITILTDPAKYKHGDGTGSWYDSELTADANEALPALRDACENCPACILAAIRQRGIPVPVVTDFDFTEEMKEVWHSINVANTIRSEG